MKVYLGSDHAGFNLKEVLKISLKQWGYDIEDCGTHSAQQCDYPDFIYPVARKVAADKNSKGIIFGGSGQGEAITANRVPGVRAAVYYGKSLDIISLSRTHNDANILSLGARFLTVEEALSAVNLWLGTAFPKEERHVKRIAKIDHD